MPFSLALPIACPFIALGLPVGFFKAYSGDFEAIQIIFAAILPVRQRHEIYLKKGRLFLPIHDQTS